MSTGNLANRLSKIMYYLNHEYTINIKELAEEFSISERQIQKDIKLFSAMYEIESLGNQKYRMKQRHKTISVKNENIDIAMALMKSFQQNAMPQMSEEIDKIFLKSKEYDKIFLFNIDYEKILYMEEFHKLLRAIRYQQSCSFFYIKKDKSKKEVSVHPYRIANFSNFWYLLAYDVKAEKIKSYHINSIAQVILANENYINNTAVEKKIEETFSKFDSPWFDSKIQNVTLKARGDAKCYLDRNQPKNIDITAQSNSNTKMNFHYYDDTEVITFVKKWLPDIQIIDNIELTKKLRNTLKDYLKKI